MSNDNSNQDTQQKTQEDLIELSHLRWHCRRGVKELDVVLNNFLENHYLEASTEIQLAFKSLLKLEDPILMSFVMGQNQTDDVTHNFVLEKMKNPYSK